MSASIEQGNQLYGVAGGAARPIGVDLVTQALLTLDYAHHEVHEGSHFFYTNSLDLGSGISQVYLLTTPDTTKWVHMTFNYEHIAVLQFALFEGADRVGTTLQTAFNNNRNSLNTPGLVVHKGISGGTTDGVQMVNDLFGYSSGNSRVGGGDRNDHELLLKQNTKYLIRLTSSTADQLIVLRLIWYEHTSKT